jgi:hypothetical protein
MTERHEPIGEVVCYETQRYGKPPMQTYELRQFDGFRALPPGTHKIYADPTDAKRELTDYEIERFWLLRSELHDGELMPQLRDFARAIERAHGIGSEQK